MAVSNRSQRRPLPRMPVRRSVRPRTPELAELSRPGATPSTSWWRASSIGALALTLTVIVVVALHLFLRPLLLLFIAVVIAQAFAPLVDRLSRRIPRSVSVAAIYFAVLVAISGMGWLIVPSLVSQGQTLVDNTPDLVERGRNTINDWVPGGGERIAESGQSSLGSFGSVLVDIPFRIATSVTELVLVIAMSIYWLLMAPALRRGARSLFPPANQANADRVMDKIGGAMGGYLRGEGLTTVLMGLIAAIGLSVIGVEYALVLALVTAIGELIPVIGPILSAIPAIAIALLDSPTQALIVLVFFIIAQQIESNVILPNIMQREVGVPPLLALFALFAGGSAFGLLGAIAAIPFAAALRVIALDVLVPAIRAWTGAANVAMSEEN